MDNYQYNVQIQFNQPVNITQEIDKVIQIQTVTRKRLLEDTRERLLADSRERLLAVTTYNYLNYTIYDYGNGLYTFVLNNYSATAGT